jgi:hypothetical protein
MLKHAHGHFRLDGTFVIHACTFFLFYHLMCCSIQPLSITTCNNVLKFPTIKHYIIESWDEISSLMNSKFYTVTCTCECAQFVVS